MRWLDEAVADGTAATAGHASREAVFNAVHEDRAGPVERRLLELTAVEPASVRLNALQLVYSLVTVGRETWDAAVQASYARLTDEDEAVRRLAAELLTQAGRPHLALAAPDELTDPAVRTVLAMGVPPEAAERLRHDSLPAVRFLAHLSLLRKAPPEDWARLDAALLADVEEAARHVPCIGERWSDTLCVIDREADTYALVRHLLGEKRPVALQRIGVLLARSACQDWRAAPVELLPHLVPHVGLPEGAEAIRTAMISNAAAQEHAALLAGIGLEPRARARRGRRGTPEVYDARSAAECLAAQPVGVARLNRAPELFGPLLDAGPLTFRQAAQLYNLTFRWPNIMQARCAPLWFRHAGEPALPRLLDLMTRQLACKVVGEAFMSGLAELGRHALPAVPALDQLIARRRRIPENEPSRDAETETDERLLAAAREARHRILTDAQIS
ncbi:hypothetical protein ABZ208_04330 [Streptomyces sp. NPDC006208]|uniref:hypothetical protein n=1 Tax=Streptomyces sp. NPDC006208 TaxID=3156734 RepID=UPI0033AB0E8D